MIALDIKENFKKKVQKRWGHLRKLQSTIRSCGVSFDIWEKKRRWSRIRQYDFTTILGSDKKKRLAELPDKLVDWLMPDTCDTVVQIWNNNNRQNKHW